MQCEDARNTHALPPRACISRDAPSQCASGNIRPSVPSSMGTTRKGARAMRGRTERGIRRPGVPVVAAAPDAPKSLLSYEINPWPITIRRSGLQNKMKQRISATATMRWAMRMSRTLRWLPLKSAAHHPPLPDALRAARGLPSEQSPAARGRAAGDDRPEAARARDAAERRGSPHRKIPKTARSCGRATAASINRGSTRSRRRRRRMPAFAGSASLRQCGSFRYTSVRAYETCGRP